MIKRQYLISGRILKEQTVDYFYQNFTHKSLLQEPRVAMNLMIKQIADKLNIDIDKVAVTTFCRC